MVFQQGVLIDSLNVGENIGLALRQAGFSPSEEAILSALSDVGLPAGDAAKMPGQLSGGMLRRASLAQVLAQKRPVIVLDEPFVGLDETSAREIVALIATLMERGNSFILISHEAQYAEPLATPGRAVQIRAHPTEDLPAKERATPHWNFAVRTGLRLFDYLVISSPMILFAFIASGIAISMLFSALAAAEATTLATDLAQGEGNRLRLFKASSTRWPLTRSRIGLSLFWEAPSCLANALTGGT